ncbi:protein kinase [Gaopeijia maritima]|uniref:RCC1 domain-containing protein n=1 Tax=Gaopeijia maritima TaxID=3119007 RepID=UPI003247DD46
MTDETLRESGNTESVRAALEALGPGFELVRELGRGATAIVYLVRDHELDRDLAVKVIRSSFGADEEAMARLEREAKLVAQLQHPNIVKLYGTRHLSDGSMVLLMEHVPGRNLKELLQDTGALPPRRAMRFLDDIASALAYAHRRRIVHRDVKPENIYIDDEVGTARLADFGVARPWDLDTRLTLPGESLGTPAYMAPEQIDGNDVDGRSDVFSLGLVAYEMLAGGHPWEGESIYSIIFKQKQEEPRSLREIRPDLSDRVVAIVERAIRKDPADRWSSAEEMLEAVKGLDGSEMDPLMHGLGLEEGDSRAAAAAVPSAPGRGGGAGRRPGRRAAPPAGRRKGRGRALLLLGAVAVLIASAWQPLGIGEALAGLGFGGGDAAEVAQLPPDAAPGAGSTADTLPPPEPGSPRLLTGRGGNAQSGPVGTALPTPLRVQVLDSAGVPVPGVEIAFAALSGEATFEPAVARSDDEGAASTTVALPATPQDIEVVARATEVEGLEARFLVSAVPASGAAFGGIDGDEQSAAPGERLPDALLVRVVDDEGEPVEAAEVEFLTEHGTVTPATDLTDRAGWAVARWTLGPEAGEQEAVARLSGSGVRVVFTATAVEPGSEDEAADSIPDEGAPATPSGPSGPAPDVARQGWDVGGTMVCVVGQGGRPFCRGGASASDDVGGVVAVSAGVTHACGIDESGQAWCWGSNDSGQLGDGSRSAHGGRPVEGLARFGRVTAGLSHSCALDGQGQAYCWGSNLSGQLGTGGRDDRTVPAPVATALRFSRITSGWNHTCALTPSGQVNCWGLNADGQLGDGGRVDRLTPVAVPAGAGFQELAAGSAHTCGLRDGQVFCWGSNQHGQLGNGTLDPSLRPTPVAGLPRVASVVAGAAHACARTTEGEVYCWGQNLHGQLGDGSNTSRALPTLVQGEITFTSLLAGGAITCGRASDGGTWCWGFNQSGQLGDGSRTSRSSPTRVGG